MLIPLGMYLKSYKQTLFIHFLFLQSHASYFSKHMQASICMSEEQL